MKDVTHTPLFESILRGEIDGTVYDLENDYQCIKMHLDGAEKKLQLRFINDDYKIIVEFHQATITCFTILPGKSSGTSLSGFYRGQFKYNNNLHEITTQGKYYYYLSFLENDAIELFAKRVTLTFSRLNS